MSVLFLLFRTSKTVQKRVFHCILILICSKTYLYLCEKIKPLNSNRIMMIWSPSIKEAAKITFSIVVSRRYSFPNSIMYNNLFYCLFYSGKNSSKKCPCKIIESVSSVYRCLIMSSICSRLFTKDAWACSTFVRRFWVLSKLFKTLVVLFVYQKKIPTEFTQSF